MQRSSSATAHFIVFHTGVAISFCSNFIFNLIASHRLCNCHRRVGIRLIAGLLPTLQLFLFSTTVAGSRLNIWLFVWNLCECFVFMRAIASRNDVKFFVWTFGNLTYVWRHKQNSYLFSIHPTLIPASWLLARNLHSNVANQSTECLFNPSLLNSCFWSAADPKWQAESSSSSSNERCFDACSYIIWKAFVSSTN